MKDELSYSAIKWNKESIEFTIKKMELFQSMDETIKKLKSNWSGFDEDKLKEIMVREDPQVSVAMLSWLRPEKLLKTLKHWRENRFVGSNVFLTVQEGLSLPEEVRQDIEFSALRFYCGRVNFTEKNEGTGGPRKKVIYRALRGENCGYDAKNAQDSPYIMTIDDDMIFPRGLIEAQIYLLEEFENVGAVCSWCIPNAAGHMVSGKRLVKKIPTAPYSKIDIMGSATMMMKRELFDNVEPDENYFIGWGDFDFCMQIKKAGWDLLVLALSDFKATNDYGGPEEYHKFRYKREHSINSANLFYKKWGIKIL